MKKSRPSTISKPAGIEDSVVEIDISEQDLEFHTVEEDMNYEIESWSERSLGNIEEDN